MTINNDTFFRPEAPSVHPISSTPPTTQRLTTQRLTTLTSLTTIECVLDCGGISAHTIGGVVVDSWDSADRMLLGVDQTARIAFFSDDFSLQVFAYDLDRQAWIVDTDPAFPRFTLEEDPFAQVTTSHTDALVVIDLDRATRHQLLEAEVVAPPSRLSA